MDRSAIRRLLFHREQPGRIDDHAKASAIDGGWTKGPMSA
jgi:hypothetical protein